MVIGLVCSECDPYELRQWKGTPTMRPDDPNIEKAGENHDGRPVQNDGLRHNELDAKNEPNKSKRDIWLTKAAEFAAICSLLVALIMLGLSISTEPVRYGYARDFNGQPISEAEQVGNSEGAMSPVADTSRFEILKEWKTGHRLYIFGPVQSDGKRRILSEGRLMKDGNEWIFVPSNPKTRDSDSSSSPNSGQDAIDQN